MPSSAALWRLQAGSLTQGKARSRAERLTGLCGGRHGTEDAPVHRGAPPPRPLVLPPAHWLPRAPAPCASAVHTLFTLLSGFRRSGSVPQTALGIRPHIPLPRPCCALLLVKPRNPPSRSGLLEDMAATGGAPSPDEALSERVLALPEHLRCRIAVTAVRQEGKNSDLCGRLPPPLLCSCCPPAQAPLCSLPSVHLCTYCCVSSL